LLEEKGVAVIVAASSSATVTSYEGWTQVQPDILLNDVDAADYDVIVFVGGYPYSPSDSTAQRIARAAVAEGKLVAGICNGVITMAKAGVLEGKRVTALTYHPALELENEGAVLTDAAVERDGLIITGNGPGASGEFGEAIAAALEE